METYELRYFLAAAESESINKAAACLSVSSPAVSRAISRLEEELGIQLFERKGRNVVLSPSGKDFQRRASRIIGDLDELKSHFKPSDHIPVSLAGTEFGVSAFLCDLIEVLNQSQMKFSFEIKSSESSKAVERSVLDGEARLGIMSRPPSQGLSAKKLGTYLSKVYVGKKHPLFSPAKRRAIPIEELLTHEFVSFLGPSFLEAENALYPDGWREDKFKRRVTLKAESIHTALSVVERGRYVGYFPELLAVGRELAHLKVTGCPYRCETSGYLIARDPSEFGWMKRLF
jgi:LysR family transcriptional activator of glutamate synthase operon